MSLGHVLIFGGTGMLAEATGWITTNADHTIAYGRNKTRLERLEKMYGEHGLEVKELDYSDIEALKSELKTAFKQHGPIYMVVAWIHSTAPTAVPTIMKQVSELQIHQWTLILIKGSSSYLSSIISPESDIPENCYVKEVLLGFIYNGTTSRWLTHQEISEGVIQAIQGNKTKTVVGTLEPWEKRP
ncbi:hypothetical protein SAMN05877753_102786 [Bacillus oleivorans]|uniref:Short subunit dehydrogenase n=1 Tax=Bacillus oleivorans TaxID=1448271 RepID=A0A285CN20_9BACI|nr:short-chain dehydrogenase [Bacillus oleivorans]SNX68901.1 hypothetical protein SAMN05877753_102786 [Bacillus oleivorans]